MLLSCRVRGVICMQAGVLDNGAAAAAPAAPSSAPVVDLLGDDLLGGPTPPAAPVPAVAGAPQHWSSGGRGVKCTSLCGVPPFRDVS